MNIDTSDVFSVYSFIKNREADKMYHRIVLVNFKENIDQEGIDTFISGLQLLADNTHYLLDFKYARLIDVSYEDVLGKHVPDVNRPDFMSTWTFSSASELESFISSDIHKDIAKQYFKPAVKTRTVFNYYQ